MTHGEEEEVRVDARTGDEIGLIPEGIHNGIVTEMSEIRESKSKGYFYVVVKVSVDGQTLHTFISSHRYILAMILSRKAAYLHDEVTLKVQHREYQGKIYPSASIIWE